MRDITMNSQEKAVIDIVCDVSGLTFEQIKSKNRSRHYAFSRAILGYMLRRIVGCTLIRTGMLIGRDHCTIIYYEKTYEDNRLYDREYSILARKVEKVYNNNFTAIRLNLINDKIANLSLRLVELKDRRDLVLKEMGEWNDQ
tara:strand:- start:739 stop:1164 length:426 start_codon:yes stop_codon:yes gene_type:complete